MSSSSRRRPLAGCSQGEEAPLLLSHCRLARLHGTCYTLTLCPHECGRFLVPPAGATTHLAAARRSPAVPKRYVPVCPTVPLLLPLPLSLELNCGVITRCRTGSQTPCWVACASPASRISSAAFWSRSRISPQWGQLCVRTDKVFHTSSPQPEPAWLVYWGGTAIPGPCCTRP